MRHTGENHKRLDRRGWFGIVGAVTMLTVVLSILMLGQPMPAHAFVLGADGVGIDFSLVDLDRSEYRIGVNYYVFMSSRPDGLRQAKRRYNEDCEEDEITRPVQERQYAVNLSKDTIEGVVGDTLYWPECQWLVFDFSFDAEPRVREEIRKRMREGRGPFAALHLTGQRDIEDERDIVVTSFPDSLSVRVGIRTTSRWVGGPGARRLSVGITNGRSKIHWRLRPLGIQLISLGFPYTVEDREEIVFALRDYRTEMDERASLPEYGGFKDFADADTVTRERIRTEVWHEFVQTSFDQTEPRSPVTVARKQQVAAEEAAAAVKAKEDAEAARLAALRAQEEKERKRDAELAALRAELERLKKGGTATATATAEVMATATAGSLAGHMLKGGQLAPSADLPPSVAATVATQAATSAKIRMPFLITGIRPEEGMEFRFSQNGTELWRGVPGNLVQNGVVGGGVTYKTTIEIPLNEGQQVVDFEMFWSARSGRKVARGQFKPYVVQGASPFPINLRRTN